MTNLKVVLFALEDNVEQGKSSAAPQPAPWWSVLLRIVARLSALRKYQSTVGSVGIFEGHGGQKAFTSASLREMLSCIWSREDVVA